MIPILTVAGTVLCPHGGNAILTTRQIDATIDGAPALTQADLPVVAGCAFAIAGIPSPCLTIRWVSGSTQMRLRGVPLVLQTSVGLCLNAAQAPQGVALVVQSQQSARGL